MIYRSTSVASSLYNHTEHPETTIIPLYYIETSEILNKNFQITCGATLFICSTFNAVYLQSEPLQTICSSSWNLLPSVDALTNASTAYFDIHTKSFVLGHLNLDNAPLPHVLM